MTIEDQIRDEKPQYDIIREAAKILALSLGKIDNYEYLTSKEILPSNQAKFIYSPLGKAFEKKTETIKNEGEKQIEAIQDKDQLNQTKSLLMTYSPIVLKEKDIHSKLTEKSFEKINNLDKKVDIDK